MADDLGLPPVPGNPMGPNAPAVRFNADPDFQRLVQNSTGGKSTDQWRSDNAARDAQRDLPPTAPTEQATPFVDYAPRESVARNATMKFAAEGGAASGWGADEQARNTIAMGQRVANSPMIGRPSDPNLATLEQGQLSKFSGGPPPTFAPGDWRRADQYRGTGLPMRFEGTIPAVPPGYRFNPLTGSVLPTPDVVRALTGGSVEYGPHSLTMARSGAAAPRTVEMSLKETIDKMNTSPHFLGQIQKAARDGDPIARIQWGAFQAQQKADMDARARGLQDRPGRDQAEGDAARTRAVAATTTANVNMVKAETDKNYKAVLADAKGRLTDATIRELDGRKDDSHARALAYSHLSDAEIQRDLAISDHMKATTAMLPQNDLERQAKTVYDGKVNIARTKMQMVTSAMAYYMKENPNATVDDVQYKRYAEELKTATTAAEDAIKEFNTAIERARQATTTAPAASGGPTTQPGTPGNGTPPGGSNGKDAAGNALQVGKVYTDAKGNRATWDGTKYAPVK